MFIYKLCLCFQIAGIGEINVQMETKMCAAMIDKREERTTFSQVRLVVVSSAALLASPMGFQMDLPAAAAAGNTDLQNFIEKYL